MNRIEQYTVPPMKICSNVTIGLGLWIYPHKKTTINITKEYKKYLTDCVNIFLIPTYLFK